MAYPFLGKPHDDLRKDNRMMEVVGVLNRIFLRDAAARRRNLYMRRHARQPPTGGQTVAFRCSDVSQLLACLCRLLAAQTRPGLAVSGHGCARSPPPPPRPRCVWAVPGGAILACRFMVSPLAEECGLVEWVEHTCPLGTVLQETYAAEGLDNRTMKAKIKGMYDRHQASPTLADAKGGLSAAGRLCAAWCSLQDWPMHACLLS